MNIAIIPARGGSKRIKNKNIKKFLSLPIVCWSIIAAKKTHLFNKVIVSTDDKRISKIAQKFGAEVPFMRPKNISEDNTGIHDVIIHAIKYYNKKNMEPKFVCCINATAPFIKPKDIIKGFKKIKKQKDNFVFTASLNDYPLQRSFTSTNNEIDMIFPKFYNTNSQKLKKTYHDSGQFYWAKSDTWLNNKKIFSKKSSMICIPSYRSQDINTLQDWKISELKHKILKKYEKK